MKGAVFIALQEMIIEEQGLETWHHIIDAAGSDGVYTATLKYDDQQLLNLLEQICLRFELSQETALRNFGVYLFHFLHSGYPMFADSKPDFYSFIESIDGVIHMEVLKLDDEARPPHIEVSRHPDGGARLIYSSERELCYLAEGLLLGAAKHFGIIIHIEHLSCTHHGAPNCTFRISSDE